MSSRLCSMYGSGLGPVEFYRDTAQNFPSLLELSQLTYIFLNTQRPVRSGKQFLMKTCWYVAALDLNR